MEDSYDEPVLRFLFFLLLIGIACAVAFFAGMASAPRPIPTHQVEQTDPCVYIVDDGKMTVYCHPEN